MPQQSKPAAKTKAAIKPADKEDDLSNIEEIELDRLHLDLENPRLPHSVEKTPKAILTWIAKSTSIEDLMNAIGTNGFFPGEPVVVYPDPKKDGDFIVIEGNRRLTACKLLQDPTVCEKPSAQMIVIAENAEYKPKKIPVVKAKTRNEILPYLGFRHITGVKEWDPLAKARYIKQLFDTTTEKNIWERYQSVAKAIGSRRDHIKRNLDALAVYGVLENNEFFDIEGLGEESIKFAVLSTALADDRIGRFVGTVEIGGNDEPQPTNPIVNPKKLKKASVEQLTRWLFEKKEGKTVVGESRNLRQLGAVIESTKAMAALGKGSTLAYAYRLTSGVNDDFTQHLYSAQAPLEEAAGLVANVSFDATAYDLVKQLNNLVRQIGKTLKEKQAENEDDF